MKWLYENGKHPKNTNLTVWKRPEVNAIGKYKLTEFAKSLNGTQYIAIVYMLIVCSDGCQV